MITNRKSISNCSLTRFSLWFFSLACKTPPFEIFWFLSEALEGEGKKTEKACSVIEKKKQSDMVTALYLKEQDQHNKPKPHHTQIKNNNNLATQRD